MAKTWVLCKITGMTMPIETYYLILVVGLLFKVGLDHQTKRYGFHPTCVSQKAKLGLPKVAKKGSERPLRPSGLMGPDPRKTQINTLQSFNLKKT